MKEPLSRRVLSEALATAMLLAAIVGSGIMGANLGGGNIAIALLGNTIATGAMLVALILIFGPSGAHMNPAVSLGAAIQGDLAWRDLPVYATAQVIGAIVGVWCAHLMFDLSVLQVSTHARDGAGQIFSEFVATFGLVLTILGCVTRAPHATPYAVGLYITAAYWFTASTSFANPAVTIARAMTDTFAGIAPANVGGFIAAQILGMLAGLVVAKLLWVRPPLSLANR